MSSFSPARRLPSSLLTTLDSSTGPFLRAFALGFLASTVPSFARTLLAIIWTRKGASRPALLEILRRLLDTVVKGLSPRGLAFAGGIAVGGAKWGESCVEPLVRRVVVRVVKARRAKLRQSREEEGEERGEEREGETEVVRDEVVAAVSTFVSSTIASLVALTLLQSSPSYTRPSYGRKSGPVAGPSGSPYPSLLDSPLADPSMLLPPGIVAPPPVQSPTLDLTLFVLVRAVDTMVRGVYASGARVGDGRAGEAVRFLARHADTLVFWLSSWRIMWCWFYIPERLNPSYTRWITALARLDPRLLLLLQYARNGEYVYGKAPSAKVAAMSAGIATALGQDASRVNPQFIKRLDCSFVHGKLGGPGLCEVNAARRWSRGFLDALAIYLPVHLIPHILFNLRGLTGRPLPVLLKILLAAGRSSAFLATFLTTIYASVCLVRTRLPQVFPFLNPQILDSGLGTALGCALCGFSVLIENPHRRREMALFVAPRALYALLDEIVPAFLTRGSTGAFLSRWLERAVFSVSAGTVVAATVHRPDLVSGVVRGVMGTAVGNWGKRK